MPTIIFDTKAEIPEHLQSQAREVNGKFELDATGVLNKNKELLSDNANLKTERDGFKAELDGAKTKVSNLETTVSELKSKTPDVPHGHRIVAKEVAELGEAAKAASVTKDELPTLKTKLSEFEQKELRASRNAQRAKAAAAIGLSADKFTKLAETEDFDVVSETVRENNKDVEKFFVTGKDATGTVTKTDFDAFVKSHDKFSLVLDSLKGDQQAPPKYTPFPGKEDAPPGNIFDRIRAEVKETGKKPQSDIDARFGKASTV